MQYLSELPEISSTSVDGDIIELELEQEVDSLPDLGDEDPVVLVARDSTGVTVVVGKVVEHENIGGPDIWSRIKIKGQSVTFTINK